MIDISGGHLTSVCTSIGAFVVSALSLLIGYKLFFYGATGAFKFGATGGAVHVVGLGSIAPGLAFALFGAVMAAWTLHKLVK